MDQVNDWAEITAGSMSGLITRIVDVLPSIIGAILLLILGWVIAKLVSYAIEKMLQRLGFDSFINRMIKKSTLDLDVFSVEPSALIAKFVYWILLLLFLISASDTLGMQVVSESIGILIGYLPQLFAALLIFVIGLYLAGFVRNFFKTAFESFGLPAGKFLSETIFFIILIITAITALNQAGIDTTIITANISIILGGILLAFVIAFGFSSRDILTNILSSFYVRGNFEEGQRIVIDGVEGKIKRIDSVQTVIETADGDLVIPTKRLANETILRL